MSLLTQIAADLDTPLSDYGESQIWTPAGGAATPFTGVADVNYKQIDLNTGAVISSDYAVWGKTSVIGAAKYGDAVTFTSVLNSISAVACTVQIAQKDPDDLGPGYTRLILRKA